jgi:hypothetical protein
MGEFLANKGGKRISAMPDSAASVIVSRRDGNFYTLALESHSVNITSLRILPTPLIGSLIRIEARNQEVAELEDERLGAARRLCAVFSKRTERDSLHCVRIARVGNTKQHLSRTWSLVCDR